MKPTLQTSTLWHGGDYNPEQWSPAIWDEDERLMDLAHWNVATIGVFSWVSLEPKPGKFTFDWLDDIMDRLHRRGRKAILATPSAAPPAWMAHAHPEILRVAPDGIRNRHGNRVNYCLTSAVYRARCRDMAFRLAERYGKHPALALWHASNEYGGECYCDLCQAAFRNCLRDKFDNDLDKLNAAYWTAFWSHTYTDWKQVEAPGAPHGDTSVDALLLDWKRFVTDQTIDFYENEAAPLRSITPEIPITTNFMGFYPGLDYGKFAKHVDVVSWDSYPRFTGALTNPDTWVSVSMTHDVTRGIGGGKPFLLMECTPSASNWYPVMELKTPGMHRLEGLQAIAHGSDSVQYFQWRQSRGSQEKFHGAVVAHEGTENTRVFREVADLGKTLEEISVVVGSRVEAEVGIVYDWDNAWVISNASSPIRGNKGALSAVRDFYRPFWEAGVPVDIVPSDTDFGRYKLLVLPMLSMLKPGCAERIEAFVREGGTVVGTYWTGIVDENDRCFLGGFPGPLRPLFGIWSEELDILDDSQSRSVEAERENSFDFTGAFVARGLCDLVHAEGAEVLARYGDGWYAGRPALTYNRFGQGEAYYVASRNEAPFQTALLNPLIARTGIRRSLDADLPPGVTAQRRVGQSETVFLLNCTPESQIVTNRELGWSDAESGLPLDAQITLEPFGVCILSRARSGEV